MQINRARRGLRSHGDSLVTKLCGDMRTGHCQAIHDGDMSARTPTRRIGNQAHDRSALGLLRPSFMLDDCRGNDTLKDPKAERLRQIVESARG